ncbi:TetR family transcriptional regulator [Streptomyces sp. NBC_00989]|uniref:TetR family transcriptional regulator n=1 Tax=Streptomyces sp. NBC_00989 TaxID=2903705 RepID=UPI003864AC15|nr:TetR/AcrR family transcriptional regulator [Streptomyces sp. NBC_00989]
MTSSNADPGRRERKKAATRRALSETALQLFLERGFDNITVREIAEAADVSTTTLMNYFPTKEALVFDLDDELERSLVEAVTGRAPDMPVLESLRRYMRERVKRAASGRHADRFMKLVLDTPALSDHWRKIWLRHEQVLAEAVAAELGRPADDMACAALAHLVLDAFSLAIQSADPVRMIDTAFDIIEPGWPPTNRAATD